MKILMGWYLISDQYGTSKDDVIGVFDDDDLMKHHAEMYERKHSNTLCGTKSVDVVINVPLPIER